MIGLDMLQSEAERLESLCQDRAFYYSRIFREQVLREIETGVSDDEWDIPL